MLRMTIRTVRHGKRGHDAAHLQPTAGAVVKFIVTMKDPDTLADSIEDAVKEQLLSSGLPQHEQDLIADDRQEKVYDQCSKWFRYGEYLAVEIDTEAGTCTVKEA